MKKPFHFPFFLSLFLFFLISGLSHSTFAQKHGNRIQFEKLSGTSLDYKFILDFYYDPGAIVKDSINTQCGKYAQKIYDSTFCGYRHVKYAVDCHFPQSTGSYNFSITDSSNTKLGKNFNPINLKKYVYSQSGLVISSHPIINKVSPTFSNLHGFKTPKGETFRMVLQDNETENDSLAYRILPLDSAPSYFLPGTVKINSHTSEFVWETPDSNGVYQFAILGEEYKKVANSWFKMGYTINQFSVEVTNNTPKGKLTPDNWKKNSENFYEYQLTPGDSITLNWQFENIDADTYWLDVYGTLFHKAGSNASTITHNSNTINGTFKWKATSSDVSFKPYNLNFVVTQVKGSECITRHLPVTVWVKDTTVSVHEYSASNIELLVYPNPTKDIVQVQWTTGKANSIQLFNIGGQLVHEKIISSQRSTAFHNLSSGIYFLKLNTTKGAIVQKLVVQ